MFKNPGFLSISPFSSLKGDKNLPGRLRGVGGQPTRKTRRLKTFSSSVEMLKLFYANRHPMETWGGLLSNFGSTEKHLIRTFKHLTSLPLLSSTAPERAWFFAHSSALYPVFQTLKNSTIVRKNSAVFGNPSKFNTTCSMLKATAPWHS